MNPPSWPLLFWAGAGATCAAAVAGTTVGAAARGTWSLAPRELSRARNILWTLAAGVILYPLAYGIVLELLHRSDAGTGLIIGIAHAAIAAAHAGPKHNPHRAVTVAVMHVVYAVVLTFLYVLP